MSDKDTDNALVIIDILQEYCDVYKELNKLPKEMGLLSKIEDIDDSNEIINAALRELVSYRELMSKHKDSEYSKLFDDKASYRLVSDNKTLACCELIIPLLYHKNNKDLKESEWKIELNEK